MTKLYDGKVSLRTDVKVFLLPKCRSSRSMRTGFCSTVLKFLKRIARIAQIGKNILNYYFLPLTLVLRPIFWVMSLNWVPGGIKKTATLSHKKRRKGSFLFFETFFPCLFTLISIILSKKNPQKSHLKISLFFGRTP